MPTNRELNQILIYLSTQKQNLYSDKFFLEWLHKLTQKGLVCKLIQNDFDATSLSPYINNSILITDSENAAHTAAQLNMAVLGLSSENTFFNNVNYVCDDINCITPDYLSLVYNRFHGLPLTICETQRLTIKELSISELPLLAQKISNEASLNYLNETYDEILERYKEYIKVSYPFFDYGFWGVFLKSDNTLIGHAGIQNTELNDTPCIELGYMIFPEYQKQNYGFEASKAVLEYAFHELELNEIYARISPNNLPSKALAEKLGMKYVNPEGNEAYFIITRPDYKT